MVVFAIFLLALCACQQTRKVDLETRPVVSNEQSLFNDETNAHQT